MSKVPEELEHLLSEAIVGQGFDYVGCEYFQQQRGVLLRVYIEKCAVNTAVSVDECAKVSRQLQALLAVEETMTGAYTLEVSSPGLERPLFRLAHYLRFLGEKVRIKLHHAVHGRSRFVGNLIAADENEVTVDVDGQHYVLSMLAIDKAKLVVDFDVIPRAGTRGK